MDFFQAIYDWFTIDVYNFVAETVAWLTYKLIWMRIKAIIYFYSFAWSVASYFIADLQLAARFAAVFNMISPTIKANLEFFHVFTGMSWVFQSFAAKLVINMFKSR